MGSDKSIDRGIDRDTERNMSSTRTFRSIYSSREREFMVFKKQAKTAVVSQQGKV